MMSNIKEEVPDFVKVEVKSEVNLDNTFVPANKHLADEPMVEDYTSVQVKKEFECSELNTDSSKNVNASYGNIKCKEEIKDEGEDEICNTFITENEQKVEEFSENSEIDEKIDISETILQSNGYNDDKIKLESETQMAFTQINVPDDDPMKQGKERNLMYNKKAKIKCQFCTKLFFGKESLDEHVLRKHRDEIKNDIKSFITRKIHLCEICNSFESTRKSNIDNHLHLAHNKAKNNMNCQFCNKTFARKTYLDDHILKHHNQELKGDLKSLITSKIYTCNICNSYETTLKPNIDRHVNSVHNEVKIQMKCQFCTKSFLNKRSLDGHVLRKHKDNIKNDINSFITNKIHKCQICNCFETTKKSGLVLHMNFVHNESKIKMKCQFCTESFKFKQSLDEHLLRRHKSKIKKGITRFITSKMYKCKICKSYKTTYMSVLDRHVNSVHDEKK